MQKKKALPGLRSEANRAEANFKAIEKELLRKTGGNLRLKSPADKERYDDAKRAAEDASAERDTCLQDITTTTVQITELDEQIRRGDDKIADIEDGPKDKEKVPEDCDA